MSRLNPSEHPGYLAPGAVLGATLTGQQTGRTLHNVGCTVDGGHLRHGMHGFWCRKCASSAESKLIKQLMRRDRMGVSDQ